MTKYRIDWMHNGQWRMDDEPKLYDFMSDADMAALGPQYADLTTRVTPVEAK